LEQIGSRSRGQAQMHIVHCPSTPLHPSRYDMRLAIRLPRLFGLDTLARAPLMPLAAGIHLSVPLPTVLPTHNSLRPAPGQLLSVSPWPLQLRRCPGRCAPCTPRA
jgi:hypothetical protein